MLDYTHTIVEVSREDWHAIIAAIHDKQEALHKSLNDSNLSDEFRELLEDEIKKLENIEDRMEIRFITPCTLPEFDE